MSKDIPQFVPESCDVLCLGEPTHFEPAFQRIRNQLFAELAEHGFRSIALETDRVAALALNDFVHDGVGSLDEAMATGFSHDFGKLAANRELVAWMRDHNENRPATEQLTIHGFDAPMEMFSVPSPRGDLEHVRDYLGADVELDDLLGEDERWSRSEAMMDASESIGATAEADALRIIADDLLTSLYSHAPALIASSSLAAWRRAEVHAKAALGLLRYHRQVARPGEPSDRWSRLSGVRDTIMAQLLLDIRAVERHRGRTLVFAHNAHLQRKQSQLWMGGMDLRWSCAGAIAGSVSDERHHFIAGSLGTSTAVELAEPKPDTYEGILHQHVTEDWGLTSVPDRIAQGRTRDDVPQVYVPLDRSTVESADAFWHVGDGAAADRHLQPTTEPR